MTPEQQQNYGAGAALGGGVFSLLSAPLAAYGNIKAAREAEPILQRSMAEMRMAGLGVPQSTELYNPWIKTGTGAMQDLSQFRMTPLAQYQAGNFGGVNMTEDPGVQYRMDQAQRALDTSLAKRGMALGGMATRAALEQSQNLASQEFGNAYSRQYGQWANAENARRDQFNLQNQNQMALDQYRMNQLGMLSGYGQQATTGLASDITNAEQYRMGNLLQMNQALADLRGARAAAPWQAASAGIGGMGSMLQSAGGYMMGMGG